MPGRAPDERSPRGTPRHDPSGQDPVAEAIACLFLAMPCCASFRVVWTLVNVDLYSFHAALNLSALGPDHEAGILFASASNAFITAATASACVPKAFDIASMSARLPPTIPAIQHPSTAS